MKTTLIAEGSTRKERQLRRWGISFLIGDVLFDTFGRSDIFWKNIRRYKIPLSKVQHVVISHEDWDHIDGLKSFLIRYPKTRVYVCQKSGPSLFEQVPAGDSRITRVRGTQKVSGRIFSLGEMRADTGRGILYEQALVIQASKGLSVITGCAHPGILQIVRKAQKVFNQKVHTVCGGFHLKDATEVQIANTAKALIMLGVRRLMPLHCSGAKSIEIFKTFKSVQTLTPAEGSVFNL